MNNKQKQIKESGSLFGQIRAEGSQYRIGSGLLLMFSAAFAVWQMGVLYFSSTAMSLFGRSPIPLVESDTMAVIAAGYIASIAALCLFPRRAVLMERILLPFALLASILMLFELSPATVTALFYMEAFVCVFSIGTMASVAAHQFTLETTWRDGVIGMSVGGILISIIQNEYINIGFGIFTVFSIALIGALTLFFFLIPAKIKTPFANRKNRIRMPKIFFFGTWFISGFATLLICFASTYAESVPGGVSVIYFSAACVAVLLYALWKKLGKRSIRMFGGLLALAVLGFVLAFLSITLPALRLVSCVLLGVIVALAGLWIFFAAVAFSAYPTRFIGAIGAGMGLVLALIHSALLDLLRSDTALLYGIYAALSAALLAVYIFMEPYFTYAWNRSQRNESEAVSLPAPAAEQNKAGDPLDILSEQERVLARLIFEGHTETSAAKRMNISLNTEKGYRKNLYSKLGVHSKRELFELVNGSRQAQQ